MQFPASSALLPFPPCQSSAHSEWQELEKTNVHDPPRLPRRIHFATFRPFLSLYFAESRWLELARAINPQRTRVRCNKATDENRRHPPFLPLYSPMLRLRKCISQNSRNAAWVAWDLAGGHALKNFGNTLDVTQWWKLRFLDRLARRRSPPLRTSTCRLQELENFPADGTWPAIKMPVIYHQWRRHRRLRFAELVLEARASFCRTGYETELSAHIVNWRMPLFFGNPDVENSDP